MNRSSSQILDNLLGGKSLPRALNLNCHNLPKANNRINYSAPGSSQKKHPPLAAGSAKNHLPCGLFLIFLFFLSSLTVQAEPIEDIKVFYNDDIAVDLTTRSNEFIIHTYNLDDQKRSQIKLTKIISDQVAPFDRSEAELEAAYREAFSKLQNSDRWPALYKQITASTTPEIMAIKYGIQKIPAIVINSEKVFYGVTSLEDAIEIHKGLSDED